MLRFDAATHRAVVWLDDTQVAEHEGGYTPFEADVTDIVEPGAEHRVTVVVNNVLTWQSIPPGYVEDTPDGSRQRYFHDFMRGETARATWSADQP
ncbi:MAG: sugar-binding domain-containing protein [Solirubrobacteraceae bacterium]